MGTTDQGYGAMALPEFRQLISYKCEVVELTLFEGNTRCWCEWGGDLLRLCLLSYAMLCSALVRESNRIELKIGLGVLLFVFSQERMVIRKSVQGKDNMNGCETLQS
jgi:hypothetical protein